MDSNVALDEIGVLKRREIEARILAPVLEALGRECGREKVLAIARQAIIDIARKHGSELAKDSGGNDLVHFTNCLSAFAKDDAYQIEVLERQPDKLFFDVTRCRYAELYKSLGVPDLGEIFSCCRDFSLVEGFNPEIKLTRTQTIMQGASHCDFRFTQCPDHSR